jgi:hypothetical protein
MGERVNDYRSLTASANGAADGTTLVDTSLRNLRGGREDDTFEDWYVLITSGSALGEERKVRQSRFTSDTLTFDEAFSVQIASAVTYELSSISAAEKHAALLEAIRQLTEDVPLRIIDESLIVDNLLLNPSFEIFSATFTNWTNTGTPTLSQDTSNVLHLTNAASITASGAAEGIQQTVIPNVKDVTGRAVTFGCMVRATAADKARIRLLWGSSAYQSHDYHDGFDEYQHQEITIAIPSTATEVTAVLEVADGATALFEASYLHVQPLYRYTLPTTLKESPRYISQQAEVGRPDGLFLPVGRNTDLIAGRILRLEGKGTLNEPSSDTDTAQIGAPHVAIVVALAWMHWNRARLAESASQNRARFAEDMEMWGTEAKSLIGKLKPSRMGAMRMDEVGHFEEDADGKYLVLERRR